MKDVLVLMPVEDRHKEKLEAAGAGCRQLLRQRQSLGRKGKIRTVHGLVPSRYSVVKAGSYSLLRA